MSERTYSVVGLFDSAQALLDAIPSVEEKRLGRLETYTPYPVHGLDEALGLPPSPLGKIVLVAGLLGTLTAVLFQWWMSAVDYPIPIGGKALFSWQAFVPIIFEVMELFATFTAGLVMLLVLNKLPFFGHPILSSKAAAGITRDRFALAIEADGAKIDVESAQQALAAAGANDIEVLPVPARKPVTAQFAVGSVLGIGLACLLAGYAMYWTIKAFPVLPPMVYIQDQPKLNPYKASSFFRDGHGMQLPVKGTVARGHMPYLMDSADEAARELVNPLPRTRKVLDMGRRQWNEHCALCHGLLATGESTLTEAYGAKPVSLQAERFLKAPDGLIYHAIMKGKNAMPSYAADMTEDERWAVVHYVRVLQRAQNAKDEDLP